jgi:hypothetical protein
VLDAALREVPVGVPGELYVGGDGLARGYAARPDLTAERFIPNPFGPPGSRLYRTGDRVRWLVDGTLEFLGRVDTQVKLRGHRVEPSEIELALARHASVREAVVRVVDDVGAGKRLVAYVVPRTPPLDVDALRGHLAETLPGYMIPSAIVELAALPLTPNGKLDHRALPAPVFSSRAPFVAARSPLEQLLVEIWCEVLGVEQIGVDDDFFDLGGHSLLAWQTIARVNQTLAVEVPVRRVFERPTVAGLAAAILASDGGEAALETAAIILQLAELSEDETGQILEARRAGLGGGEE